MVLKDRVVRSPGSDPTFLGRICTCCLCVQLILYTLPSVPDPCVLCLQEIAQLQADNQSAQQSRREAEGRAAAMVRENHTLLAQVSSLQTDKTQLQQEKTQLQEDVSHIDKCIKVFILCSVNACCLQLLSHASYSFWLCILTHCIHETYTAQCKPPSFVCIKPKWWCLHAHIQSLVSLAG